MRRISSALFATLAAAAMPAAALHASETVNLPRFASVELEGGGHVVLRHGAEQKVTILKGSAQFTRFESGQDGRQLKIKACETNCPHDYDLQIEIVTPQITGVAVSGGGEIEAAAGFPSQARMDTAVDGGGQVDLRALAVDNADAAVNGGGSIKLRVAGRLMAAVDGGGEIRYWGNPKISSVVNGGGAVDKGG